MWVIARQLLSREVEGVGGRQRSLGTLSQTSQQNELLLSPAALRHCPCSGPQGVHAAGDVADDQQVMSRSLGDLHAHSQGCLAEPDVSVSQLHLTL